MSKEARKRKWRAEGSECVCVCVCSLIVCWREAVNVTDKINKQIQVRNEAGDHDVCLPGERPPPSPHTQRNTEDQQSGRQVWS